MEREVRAPRLVDDQRHAVRVGDLGQARHVGDRAEVGRRHDGRPDRVRRRRERRSSASGVMQCAMCSSGSSSGATNVGRSPDMISASIVLECAFRCATTCCPDGRAPAGDVVALRGAVDEPPGAPRAPRLRRERAAPPGTASARRPRRCRRSAPGCRAPARGRRAPHQPGVGAGAALVAGHVEAARLAGRRTRAARRGRACRAGPRKRSASLGAEVGRGRSRRRPPGSRRPMTPSTSHVPSPRHRLAGLQGERDLGQRAVGAADRDQRVGRPHDQRVARLAEPGRDGEVDEGVRRRPVGSGQDSDGRPAGRPSRPCTRPP